MCCWLAASCGIVALSKVACNPQRVAKLKEGASTENEARQQFGEPVTVSVEVDGTRTMEYPRQPKGWTDYVIKIGSDGKTSSLRQLLNDDNFARMQPGMAPHQVRGLLGHGSVRLALAPCEALIEEASDLCEPARGGTAVGCDGGAKWQVHYISYHLSSDSVHAPARDLCSLPCRGQAFAAPASVDTDLMYRWTAT